jgi:hypothetical protein
MLRSVQSDARGYDTSQESLEAVLRHIDHGRVDLARSVILSMIGRKIAENG